MHTVNMDAHPNISYECIEKAFIMVIQALKKREKDFSNFNVNM